MLFVVKMCGKSRFFVSKHLAGKLQQRRVVTLAKTNNSVENHLKCHRVSTGMENSIEMGVRSS